MIIDSSAVVAIVTEEREASALLRAVRLNPLRSMSAATFLEAAIVLDGRRNPVLSGRYDQLLRDLNVQIAPVTERQAQLARRAYRDYGRGSGHRARLNFGDCFAYALAIDVDEPLLFQGDDFTHTDVRRVPIPPP